MKKVLKEFKLDNGAEMNVGDEIKADAFAEGDRVDVTGISKGKGYQGVVKRRTRAAGRMTHGGGPVHRHAGSMGSGTDPSRIFKGKIGAGHMGAEQVTVQNLDVVRWTPSSASSPCAAPSPAPRAASSTCSNTVKTLREEGRRRRQRQPAEGFRPRQPPEGFRPKQVRKGECRNA